MNFTRSIQLKGYQPKPWQTPDDCKGCHCYIPWPDYPLGGGTKTFCGYWVLMEGKGKKIELDKLLECPKEALTPPSNSLKGKEVSL